MSIRLNKHPNDSDVARYSVALNWFDRALSLDPNDAGAHLGRAQAYSLMGRNEDAVSACRAALTSCPNSGEAWDLLGDVLVELGRYSEAIDSYKAEIEISTTGITRESLSPLNNRGRFGLCFLYRLVGDLLFTLHRPTEAITHYERAMTISPDSSPFHHRLALAYYQLGEYERYEAHLEALRESCSSRGNDGDWCHYYRDIVDRVSLYRFNPDMLFSVTNLRVSPTGL
jgi:tetratricopeptide (TPR) repeat protein